MKSTYRLWIIFSILLISNTIAYQVNGQYYHTGTTFMQENKTAPFVKMRLHSTGALFRSGSTGDFGIPSRYATDTVTCFDEKYDTLIVALKSNESNKILMKEKTFLSKAREEQGKLSNLTPHLLHNEEHFYSNFGETYTALVENQFLKTRQFPSTGFSPNSNKASYANIRRFLENKNQVNPNAVRIEEMINYFSLSIAPPPAGDQDFSIASTFTDCPWNTQHHLLYVNAIARSIDIENKPPANLVFLIDNSGSMDMPNRMPLLKSAFAMLVKTLREKDRVAIVTYGGAAGIWLPPTMGHEKDKILKAIENIEVGGATAGSNGLQLAYMLAQNNPIADANNRVILATDGDFNVGVITEKELEELIVTQSKSGVKLTCLGVGMGNYKDSKIETLARHGNGNYAYLDSEQEAEKVLVNELTQNLYSVATDLTAFVQLNPSYITSYKLIGYENRKGALNGEQAVLVGGEIGSGFSLNAIFEVVLQDTSSAFISNLYGDSVGSLTFRYKSHTNDPYKEIMHPFKLNYQPLLQTNAAIRFSTAVALFGQMLRKNEATSQMNFDDVLGLVTGTIDLENWQQVQFVELINSAKRLYLPPTAPKQRKRLRAATSPNGGSLQQP